VKRRLFLSPLSTCSAGAAAELSVKTGEPEKEAESRRTTLSPPRSGHLLTRDLRVFSMKCLTDCPTNVEMALRDALFTSRWPRSLPGDGRPKQGRRPGCCRRLSEQSCRHCMPLLPHLKWSPPPCPTPESREGGLGGNGMILADASSQSKSAWWFPGFRLKADFEAGHGRAFILDASEAGWLEDSDAVMKGPAKAEGL